MLRRLGEYMFIDRILCRVLSLIVVPHRDLALVWVRDPETLEMLRGSDRYLGEKRLRNGIHIVWLRLNPRCGR